MKTCVVSAVAASWPALSSGQVAACEVKREPLGPSDEFAPGASSGVAGAIRERMRDVAASWSAAALDQPAHPMPPQR
jgi:hypothetical protein